MNNEFLKQQLIKFNENTSLKELQKYINDMIEIRGFTGQNPEEVMLLLTEEIGELAKEIRKTRKYKIDKNKQENMKIDVEGEIADVFIYILTMCRVMNINLLQALKNKEEKNCNREWK